MTLNMAAGVLIPPDTWLGLHSHADLVRPYRPGRWLRPVESASDVPREARRLMRGEMVASSDDDERLQIRSMLPVNETEYRNAAFLRIDEKSEPLRIRNPDSVLMLHTSVDAQGTLLVSRVAMSTGQLLWTVDTGVDRFKLSQILPAEHSTVFVGPRPPVPGEVSEPLIVLLDHANGRLTTHSLWR
jgi:hypothetical protein